MSGLNVAAIADTPKVMTDGNWKLGVFVDERASDEQMNKLVGVFGGQMGGPMAGSPHSSARCSASSVRRSRWSTTVCCHSVRVGNVIDFEIKDIVPFGVETGQPVRFDGMFHPVALEPDDRRGHALQDRRVRHLLRREDGASTSEFSWAA